ncbi:hypothetical protein CcaverHIS641_0102310 [Cutaneotrichosporon cavernicola]|nr:hypothetical protein CcaverHIS641_0102310 [Cutaneotrichosporon cavernicola]
MPMMAPALIIAAAALAAIASAQQPGSSWQYPVFFNYTIEDTSALWSYSPGPTADDPSRFTWNDTFSGSNWTTYVPGQAGIGESGKFANATGPGGSPSLYLNFPLTSFDLLGDVLGLNYSAPVAPLQMIIDSRTPMNCTPTPGVICSATNLIWAFHKIQVSLTSGNWTVRGIRVTTGAAIKHQQLEDTKIDVEPFVFDNHTLNPFFNFTGDWKVWDTLGGVGGQEPVNFTSLVGQDGARVNMTVPPRTAWIVINGTVRPDSDEFQLDWDPLPPLADSQMLFSAYNAWEAPALLYAAPLDPQTNYTVGITTYEDWDTNPINGTSLGLTTVTFYNERDKPILPGQPEPVPTNNNAIIAGVVGGVGGTAIIAGLLWWFCWRKRKRGKGKNTQLLPKEGSSSNLDVDEDPYIELNDMSAARPTPYINTSPAPTPVANGNETMLNGSALRKAAMLAAASGSGHTQLLGNDSGPPLSPIDVTPQHSLLPSPTGSRTTHTLPSPGGISPISPTSVAPSPVGTMFPGTIGPHLTGMTGMSGINTNINGPVHPIAAELKHGSSLRRPPQRQVAQEEDGGAVDEYELVPPVYNPAWAQQRRQGSSQSGFGGPNLGEDPEGVPLTPTQRAPPPTLSVITSSPYMPLSASGSPRSSPTSATTTPRTALGSHIPSPLSAVSNTSPVPPPLSATSTHPPSPLAMTNRLAPSDYSHESYDRQSSEYVHYDSPPADEPLPIERSQGNVASLVSRFQIAVTRDATPRRPSSSSGRRASGWAENVADDNHTPSTSQPTPDIDNAPEPQPVIIEPVPEPEPPKSVHVEPVPAESPLKSKEKDTAKVATKGRPKVLKPSKENELKNHTAQRTNAKDTKDLKERHGELKDRRGKPLPRPSMTPGSVSPAPPRALKPKLSMPKLKPSHSGPSDGRPPHKVPRRPASAQPFPQQGTGASMVSQRTGGSSASRGSVGSDSSPSKPTASSLAKLRPRSSLGATPTPSHKSPTPTERRPRHSTPIMRSPPSAQSASTSRLMQGTAASRARAAAVQSSHTPTKREPSTGPKSLKSSTSSASSARSPPSKSTPARSPPAADTRKVPAPVGRSPIGRLGLAAAREAPRPDEVAANKEVAAAAAEAEAEVEGDVEKKEEKADDGEGAKREDGGEKNDDGTEKDDGADKDDGAEKDDTEGDDKPTE